MQQSHPVEDASNGFLKISYLDTEDNLLSDDQRQSVKQQLADSVWNPSLTPVIANYSKRISDYLSAADYPYFQISLGADPHALPGYLNIMDMGRLTLLKSRQSADQGELDYAIFLAEKALIMSTRVKSDRNEILISFVIGVAMQNEALRWINKLSQNYPLSADNQRQLLKTFNSMPIFNADGFKEVFAGEYRFSVAITDAILNTPLAERWQTYQRDEDYWNMDLDADYDFGRENIKEEIYSFLSTLFPHFYVHRNESLSRIAKVYTELSEQAELYCHRVPTELSNNTFSGLTWSMLIRPNGGTRLWEQGQKPQFYQYFIRRCLSQTHIEATKSLIALRLFHIDHGRYPAELDALVPTYLKELPIDPFDGKPIRYSSTNQWVYSLGANFKDDGGSAEACLENTCFQRESCADNPTFPLQEHICSVALSR